MKKSIISICAMIIAVSAQAGIFPPPPPVNHHIQEQITNFNDAPASYVATFSGVGTPGSQSGNISPAGVQGSTVEPAGDSTTVTVTIYQYGDSCVVQNQQDGRNEVITQPAANFVCHIDDTDNVYITKNT